MPQRIINVGSVPNDGTGDPLRTSMQKIGNNFNQIFSAIDFEEATNTATVANTLVVTNLAVNSVFANGSAGYAGQYLTSDGTDVYWSFLNFGADKQVQFNDNGTANGSPGFTYDKGSYTVSVTNNIITSKLTSTYINVGSSYVNTSGFFTNGTVNALALSVYPTNTSPVTNVGYTGTATGYDNTDIMTVVAPVGGVNATIYITTNATGGSLSFTIANSGSGFLTTGPAPTISVTNSSSGSSNGSGATFYANLATGFFVANTLGVFSTGTVNAFAFTLGTSSSINSTAVTFYSNTFQVGSAVKITGTGNVGINNTTPTHALSINGQTYHGANVTFKNGATLIANGAFGTTGQVLISNGTSLYWGTPATLASVNTDATYSWSNLHSFSNVISFTGNIKANGAVGTNLHVLTTNGTGVYWSDPVNLNRSYAFANTISSVKGFVANSAFSGSFSHGTIVDYASGTGRISVGSGDKLSFYTGGANNTLALQILANNALMVNSSYLGLGESYYWQDPSDKNISQGKTTLPNGFTMKWGIIKANKYDGDDYFRNHEGILEEFLEALLHIHCHPYGNIFDQNVFQYPAYPHTFAAVQFANNSHFRIRTLNETPYYVHWLAIGR